MKKILWGLAALFCIAVPIQKSSAQAIWPAAAGDSMRVEFNCLDSLGKAIACDSVWFTCHRYPTSGNRVLVDSGRATAFGTGTAIGTGKVMLLPGRDTTYLLSIPGNSTVGYYQFNIKAYGGTMGAAAVKLTTPYTRWFVVGPAVTSTYLAAADPQASTIAAADFAAGAIDATAIATGAVDADAIAANAIGASEIATDAIGAVETAADADMLALSANGRKFNATFDGATNDNIDANVVLMQSNTITAAAITDGAIGAAEIATDAIGSAEIANNAIDSTEIAAGAIDTSEIRDNAIDANAIAPDAIGASEIATAAITQTEVEPDYSTLVTTDNIGINWGDITNPTSTVGLTNTTVGTVTTTTTATNVTNISAGGITAASIANGAIDSATFADDVRANFLNRVVHTGTAAGASATTLTLAANSFADDEINGNIIYVRSGTGSGQARRIVNFVAATEVATVDSAFTTTPTGAIYFIYPDADRTLLANHPAHGGSAAVVTGNRLALTSTSGPGITVTGATNQPAVQFNGAGTTGDGLEIVAASSGIGIDVQANNGPAIGVLSNNETALQLTGGGNGHGLLAIGHGTGRGIYAYNEGGTGPGMEVAGGATGGGLVILGGTTSGAAESLKTTAGHGIVFSIGGAGKEEAPGIASNVADSNWMSTFDPRNDVANSWGQAATTNLNTLGWAQTGSSTGADSGVVARIVKRMIAGMALNGTDSLTVSQRTTTSNNPCATCTFGTLYTDTVYTWNTTSSSTIPNVNVQVRNSSGTVVGTFQTNASGKFTGTFDAGTYLLYPYFTSGIAWASTDNPDTFVVTGNAQIDTIKGQTISYPAPPVGGQISVSGNVFDLVGDSMPGVTVEFSLNQNAYFSTDDTTNMSLVAKEARSRQTDVSGRWSVALYPTTKLLGDDRRKGVYYTCKIYMPDGITTYENSGQITFSHDNCCQVFQYKNYRPWVTQ